MICDLIYLLCALVVPLVVRPRWLVVVVAVTGCGVAGIMAWQAGLEEDVPPLMLAFAIVAAGAVVVGVALIVHAVKGVCLRRWRGAR